MSLRFGVDVGGTFTDIVVADDESGEIRVGKVPTVSAEPDKGVLEAVQTLFPDGVGGDAKYFLHGTTVGLNALLQRAGSKLGLIATEGFRDVLEIRRGDRVDPNQLLAEPIRPLIRRRLRMTVSERMLADGTVYAELDHSDVAAAYRVFEREGVEVIVVALLNAYANPAHELAVADQLRELGFAGEITTSHEISREYREYERTSTTVVDAYIRPLTRSYLERLAKALRGAGVGADLLMTRPDGGAITFSEAADQPFETILSGPVGGVQGASELARRLDVGDVITADVGGTSFDAALIVDGKPSLMYEGEVGGMPLQTPWVDVRSIGAGGGSIAFVDDGGLLQVGPKSAGAVPGPACYGRGGTEPTVTDAAFLLGMLPKELASGLPLSAELAERAMQPLVDRLEMDLHGVARGVLVIVTAAMSGTMREITIEQGFDPRGATLMPFGGAGPLFGTLLAGELGIRDVLVPPFAGNFSAWGMLGADLVRSATRSKVMPLSEGSLQEVNGILSDLFADLGARVNGEEHDKGVALDMRYKGQEHTITVSPAAEEGSLDPAAVDALADLFAENYRTTYSYNLEAGPEIVTTRATVRQGLGSRRLAAAPTSSSNGTQGGDRQRAFSFVEDDWLDFTLIPSTALAPESSFEGPALIFDQTSTIYVDSDFRASVDAGGVLRLRNTKLTRREA